MRASWIAVLSVVLAGVPLVAPAATAGPPTCEGEKATIVGTTGPDTLEGTSKRDVIVGLAGDDVSTAGVATTWSAGATAPTGSSAGPATTSSSAASTGWATTRPGPSSSGDVLDGGDGDDLLVGVHDKRKVDAHRLPDTFSWTEAATGVVVDLSDKPGVATGQGTDTLRFGPEVGVRGSAYADTITGSAGEDHLQGGLGDDTLRGGEGDDLHGEEVGAESGDDLVVGGPGADLLGSYAGRDDVRGGTGDDFVEAYSDKPTRVAGDAGADYVAQNITAGPVLAVTAGAGASPGRSTAISWSATPADHFTIDLRSGTTSADVDPPTSGTIGNFEEYRLVGNLTWRFQVTPGRPGLGDHRRAPARVDVRR